jgi:hypothetical protein
MVDILMENIPYFPNKSRDFYVKIMTGEKETDSGNGSGSQ